MPAPDEQGSQLDALLSDQHEDLTALTAVMEELEAIEEDTSADEVGEILQERLDLERALRAREDQLFEQLTTDAQTTEDLPRLLKSMRSLVLARGLGMGTSLHPTDVVTEMLTELRSVLLDHRRDWEQPPGLEE